jgi:hypothetical protein
MKLPTRGVSAFLIALALAASACNKSTPTEPTPTPTTPTLTETFEGTLTKGGAEDRFFPVPTPGDVSFTLTAVGPLSTLALGFGAGMWDPTTNACTVNVTNTNVRQGFVLLGNAPVAGTYCFRIGDVGNIAESATVTFTVVVVHPTTS